MAPRDAILERFYVETACERGGCVLDLACGSGRLTVPLAQSGLEVVGADLSCAMLERARNHARANAVEPRFIQLDMRDFDLGGRTFDTIIVAVNSILHLHSPDDSEASSGRSADTYRCRAGWCSTPSCPISPCSTLIPTSAS
ncbi:class I SAM-dependent methyltransferase [Bradyrhizobium forestalis]